MRLFDLISDRPWVWGGFVLYIGALAWLAMLGRRAAKRDARSYAIGTVHPVVAGMTLAAAIASTATFVINPGFVYVHGISAFMHLGVAAAAGMTAGLLLVCGRFRRLGAASGAVTLPQWVAKRYGSRGLGLLFAGVNMLSIAFVVLILGGLAIVMNQTLGLSHREALLVIVVVVFGYVFLGGAYANAYANTLQAAIMAVVAVIIVGSGIQHLLSPAASLDTLAAAGPGLEALVNPQSSMFSSVFSIYVAGFVIGFALMCQPHVMTTALYVKDDAGIRRALAVAVTLMILFSAVLLAGLYARLDGITPAQLTDANGVFRQDRLMALYLTTTFPAPVLALVTLAILAAGMSTMSAILVALSSIAGNDLWSAIRKDSAPGQAQRAARWFLVAIGVVSTAIALNPPKLLGIFGQLGAYGVVTASAAPLVLGALIPRLGATAATAAAIIGPVVHFGLYFGAPELGFAAGAKDLGLDLSNPGVTASVAILCSAAVALASLAGNRAPAPVTVKAAA